MSLSVDEAAKVDMDLPPRKEWASLEVLAQRFEEHKAHLRSTAFRLLGSLADADDAVQEAWLRMTRADPSAVKNPCGWMTTIVTRVCLNVLRSRRSRQENPMGFHLSESVFSGTGENDPTHNALMAERIGIALLLVLEMLGPAERLAFVLHDVFAVPFDKIAPVVRRSPTATRQLASRARRRIRQTATAFNVDLTRQPEVVDAFFAAAHHGRLHVLVAVLDPDIVARFDNGELDAACVVAREASCMTTWRNLTSAL